MNRAGVPFRATRDIDMVLCTEKLNAEFIRAFRGFISDGRYSNWADSEGSPRVYRFLNPQSTGYPSMIELFARSSDDIVLAMPDNQIGRVNLGGSASGLSAILLDDDYYSWTLAGRDVVSGLSVARAEHLIPLKALAWLNLSRARRAGARIQSTEVRKHKNDVFRLYSIADPEYRFNAPVKISRDVGAFVAQMHDEKIDMHALGLGGMGRTAVLSSLAAMYAVAL